MGLQMVVDTRVHRPAPDGPGDNHDVVVGWRMTGDLLPPHLAVTTRRGNAG